MYLNLQAAKDARQRMAYGQVYSKLDMTQVVIVSYFRFGGRKMLPVSVML